MDIDNKNSRYIDSLQIFVENNFFQMVSNLVTHLKEFVPHKNLQAIHKVTYNVML